METIERKCPFCANIDRLWEIWLEDGCHVMCAQCEALGPPGKSWVEAVKKWNERVM